MGMQVYKCYNWGEPERAPHRRYNCAISYIMVVVYGTTVTRAPRLAAPTHVLSTYCQHVENHLRQLPSSLWMRERERPGFSAGGSGRGHAATLRQRNKGRNG